MAAEAADVVKVTAATYVAPPSLPRKKRDQRVHPPDPYMSVHELTDKSLAVPRVLLDAMRPLLRLIVETVPCDSVQVNDGHCGTDRRGPWYMARRRDIATDINAEIVALGLADAAVLTDEGYSRTMHVPPLARD